MKFYHKSTGFYIADPDFDPLNGSLPEYSELKKAAEQLILSSSGWRKVFASDGDEESTTVKISYPDMIIAGIMALTFSGYIKEKTGTEHPLIAVGMDSRHTGPAISDIMCRIFIAEGLEIENLFISAAPEIMAYSAVNSDIAGFAYISASHNPIGHNGLKFGRNGGVIGGADSAELIDRFKKFLDNSYIINMISSLLLKYDKVKYKEVIEKINDNKKKALKAYTAMAKTVITDSNIEEEQNSFFTAMKNAALIKKTGIIGELNGSARTLSIDSKLLPEAGIELFTVNDTPRKIVHRIVPEGYSLDLCRKLLEKKHKEDPAYILGYVPDNDGDRGNIVFINRQGTAEILEAQEVFALAVLGELAFLYSKFQNSGKETKFAVAVNGPTSMRIDRIAEVFGAKTFRAEVGEANVVTLAQTLRESGYTVRILGEGSNGGNITHPAKVRDPINTVFSLLKILLYKIPGTEHDLFRLWCSLSGREEKYTESYTLSDVIETLPEYVTTNAYEKRAIMRIDSTDHGALKARYEKVFIKEWESKRDFLKKEFDIYSWKEVNYEGINAVVGTGSKYRSGKETGGLKIIFSDKNGEETDYIWMRGSGTEPVFRILADCTGTDKKREDWLLNWHRQMIEKADKGEQG